MDTFFMKIGNKDAGDKTSLFRKVIFIQMVIV